MRQICAECAHIGRLSQKLAQKVKRMQRLIDKHAAALCIISAPPVTFRIIVTAAVPCDNSPRSEQSAVSAAVNQLLCIAGCRIKTVLKTDAKLNIFAVFSCRQPLKLIHIHNGRFFKHNVNATFQCRFCHRQVKKMRCTDVQNINVFITQHIIKLCICRSTRLCRHRSRTLGLYIANGAKLNPVFLQRRSMNSADCAAARYCRTVAFHQ